MAKDMSNCPSKASLNGDYMRRHKGKVVLLLDIGSQSQQDATKVIKKVRFKNLSRNGLTFGNEHDGLVVTKGLKWKAILRFR